MISEWGVRFMFIIGMLYWLLAVSILIHDVLKHVQNSGESEAK